MTFVGLLLGVFIGLALGMLGGGGSILTVPVLVYVMGFEVKEAVAMSLLIVGLTSLLGAFGHWRSGNVNLRVGLVFGAIATVATYAGARLAVHLSGDLQLILFATIALLAALAMLRDKRPEDPQTSRELSTPIRSMPLRLIALEGVVVGVTTGLVGIGGGFLVVPALVLLGGVSVKEALGTSLLVIAMKSGAGFAGYLGQVEVPWGFAAAFAAFALFGVVAGTYAARFVPPTALRRCFAVFLILTSILVLYQNREALLLG